jgi:hypothetical protein
MRIKLTGRYCIAFMLFISSYGWCLEELEDNDMKQMSLSSPDELLILPIESINKATYYEGENYYAEVIFTSDVKLNPELSSKFVLQNEAGYIKIEFFADSNGYTIKTKVVESRPGKLLDARYLDIIKRWTIEPKIKNRSGVSGPFYFDLTVCPAEPGLSLKQEPCNSNVLLITADDFSEEESIKKNGIRSAFE